MNLLRDSLRALKLTVVLWLITVVLYTLPLLAIGQGFFPFQANGSLLRADGRVVGSALIGQPFASDRYFWSRPSAIDYSTGKAAPASSPSNLGPTNPDLAKRIAAADLLLSKGGITDPAADLLYASGSGLDPHISVQAAAQQVPRLAGVRGVTPQQLQDLIRRYTDGAFLGFMGEPGVNVLRLNLALDKLSP